MFCRAGFTTYGPFASSAGGSFLPLAGGTLTGPLVLPVGSVSDTSLNFGTAGTGLYSVATSSVDFATSGTLRVTMSDTSTWSRVPFMSADGSASSPAYKFSSGGATGMYRTATGALSFSVNGNDVVTLSSGLLSTFTGPIIAPAPTTSATSIRLPHGTAPSAPTNGDMWTTTAGLFARVNGATVGPYGTGGGGIPEPSNDSKLYARTTVSGVSSWNDLTDDFAAKLDSSTYTAADVLTKIKTVDGIGSGLDADLLQGNDGPHYKARTNHTGVQAQSTVVNLVSDLATKAPLASPVFTGDPTAPTPATGDNDTSIATTAFVQTAVDTATGAGLFGYFDYTFNPSAFTPPPIAGNFRMNNATQSSATHIYIHEQTATNNDASLMLAQIQVGDKFLIQRKSDATQWQHYNITAIADMGTYWDFTVTWIEGGSALTNARTGIIVQKANTGGGGGSTAWADITGKPSTFPPTVPIAQADITNLTTDLAGKVAKTGDTMSGGLTITNGDFWVEKPGGWPSFSVSWTAGFGGMFGFYEAGSLRYDVMGNDFGLYFKKYTNAGVSTTVLEISRSTGLVKVAGDPTEALGIATKQYSEARANHTGTQTASTISNFNTAADARISAAVGVSVQAYDADLTSWASITPSTKLDTSAYTAADVLTKILTVDGSGSGLDADLLDGQSGAYYLAYGNLTGVPSTFAPSTHSHPFSDITGTLSAAQHNVQTSGSLHAAVTTSVNGFMSSTDKTKLDAFNAASTYAPLASPSFTGSPQAPTPVWPGTANDIATVAFVESATEGKQDFITAGTTSQYWRGDKTWQTLDAVPEAPSDGVMYARKSGDWEGFTYVPVSPSDDTYYGRRNNSWVHVTEEAPADGTEYVRKDTTWVHPTGGGGGGIEEAPIDGVGYARQDADWVPVATGGGVPEAPEDGQRYVRQDGDWEVTPQLSYEWAESEDPPDVGQITVDSLTFQEFMYIHFNDASGYSRKEELRESYRPGRQIFIQSVNDPGQWRSWRVLTNMTDSTTYGTWGVELELGTTNEAGPCILKPDGVGGVPDVPSDGKTYARRNLIWDEIPVIQSGGGHPSGAVGAEGDVYLDTDTGIIYGPKVPGEILSGDTGIYESASGTLVGGVMYGARVSITGDIQTHGVDFYVDTVPSSGTCWIYLFDVNSPTFYYDRVEVTSVFTGWNSASFSSPWNMTTGEDYYVAAVLFEDASGLIGKITPSDFPTVDAVTLTNGYQGTVIDECPLTDLASSAAPLVTLRFSPLTLVEPWPPFGMPPDDGGVYGRKGDGTWAYPATGISDAPSDGTYYVRRDGIWYTLPVDSASDVLTKIKTVDGSGSGLDADLLDAQTGSYYLDRTNHTGTQSYTTVTGLGTAAVRNISVGTSAPGSPATNDIWIDTT
jgi:hypothetical protein